MNMDCLSIRSTNPSEFYGFPYMGLIDILLDLYLSIKYLSISFSFFFFFGAKINSIMFLI